MKIVVAINREKELISLKLITLARVSLGTALRADGFHNFKGHILPPSTGPIPSTRSGLTQGDHPINKKGNNVVLCWANMMR